MTINLEMSDWKHSTFLCKRIKSQGCVLKEVIITNSGTVNVCEVMIPEMSG